MNGEAGGKEARMALLEGAPGEARRGAVTQGVPCAPEPHPHPWRLPPAGTVVTLGGEASLRALGFALPSHPGCSREAWFPGPRAPLLRTPALSLLSGL